MQNGKIYSTSANQSIDCNYCTEWKNVRGSITGQSGIVVQSGIKLQSGIVVQSRIVVQSGIVVQSRIVVQSGEKLSYLNQTLRYGGKQSTTHESQVKRPDYSSLEYSFEKQNSSKRHLKVSSSVGIFNSIIVQARTRLIQS